MTYKTTFIYGLCEIGSHDVRYIGKTNNIKKRLNTHLNPAKKEKSYKCKWVNSVLERGGKIEIFAIDEVDINQWEFWETYWISQFKSWGFKLTNLNSGGAGLSYHTKESKEKLKQANIGEKNPNFGNGHLQRGEKNHRFGKKATNAKAILQYDLDGNFIKEWETIKSATKKLNIKSIHDACSKKTKVAGGFVWRYKVDDFPIKIEKTNTKTKKVLQISKNGEIIKIWNSIREAQISLNLSHISKVCNNHYGHKTIGGFIWKFFPIN